jgi:hypothetical protein
MVPSVDDFWNQLFALVFLLAGFCATWFAYELILKWCKNDQSK